MAFSRCFNLDLQEQWTGLAYGKEVTFRRILFSSTPLIYKGIYFKTASGHLKWQIVLNPMYTMSFSYTYSFSTAYPSCQHHHSRALGSLLSKIRVT